jgi:LacI family transcriptional regulator
MKPDGVVLAPFYYRESKVFVARLREKAIPFIFIDSELRQAGQLAYVGQDSFRSGAVAAKLLGSITHHRQPVMVIHFAKEMDNQNHLVEREKGFYHWFRQHQPEKKITTCEISNTNDEAWESGILDRINNQKTGGIFVTNSKVFLIARLLQKQSIKGIKLIGHDLLEENKKFLGENIVDFLICQRPEEQGYHAVNKLFQYVVRKKPVEESNYTSIDIVTNENVDYYKEFKS